MTTIPIFICASLFLLLVAVILFVKVILLTTDLHEEKVMDYSVSVSTKLDSIEAKDLVCIEFKDPRTMGIVTKDASHLIRFNPGELDDRVVRGTVTRIWFEGIPLNTRLIEIALVKDQGNSVRKMLFLEEEIERIEKLG